MRVAMNVPYPAIFRRSASGRLPPVSRFLNGGSSFRAAQWAASMVEGERDSVRVQSPLMQINADAICLVRTQFQQLRMLGQQQPTLITILKLAAALGHPAGEIVSEVEAELTRARRRRS